MESPISSFQYTDYPELFHAAEAVSESGKDWYFVWIIADLFFLGMGAVFSSFTLEDPELNRLILVLSALLLGIGILITFILGKKTHKNRWYKGRAIAESIKTLTWRYMMRGDPFSIRVEKGLLKQKFAERMGQVIRENQHKALFKRNNFDPASQVTEKMDVIQKIDLEQRKRLYLEYRVYEQRDWYTGKAIASKRGEKIWFWVVGFAQTLAVAAAIMMIFFPDALVNPTGIFSTLAASALAWLQVKQHEELAQSYAAAADELTLAGELISRANLEGQFVALVSSTEAAMSREHTLWLVRGGGD